MNKLEFTIRKRNHRLKMFFETLDLDVKIIGNPNTPSIILNNKKVLNCYVHNFDLRFLDQWEDGKILFEFKLQHEYNFSEEDKDVIFDWLFSPEIKHKECFRVRLVGTELCLSGYNNIHKDEHWKEPELYPVFAEHNFKIYFHKQAAEEKVKEFSHEELQLEVV